MAVVEGAWPMVQILRKCKCYYETVSISQAGARRVKIHTKAQDIIWPTVIFNSSSHGLGLFTSSLKSGDKSREAEGGEQCRALPSPIPGSGPQTPNCLQGLLVWRPGRVSMSESEPGPEGG